MSGLKLQALLVNNPTTNAGATTNIAPGASNPYSPWGAGNDLTLPKGGSLEFYFHDQTEDVDGTHKTLDLAGTGTDVLQLVMVFG
jgi:hypothetical protein